MIPFGGSKVQVSRNYHIGINEAQRAQLFHPNRKKTNKNYVYSSYTFTLYTYYGVRYSPAFWGPRSEKQQKIPALRDLHRMEKDRNKGQKVNKIIRF